MEIEEEIASYLQEKSTKLIVTHSQKENCTLSCGVIGVHFMRTRYSKCNCSEDTVCPLSFKVNYCQKSKHSEIFEEPDKLVECIKLIGLINLCIYICINVLYQLRFKELCVDIIRVSTRIELSE